MSSGQRIMSVLRCVLVLYCGRMFWERRVGKQSSEHGLSELHYLAWIIHSLQTTVLHYLRNRYRNSDFWIWFRSPEIQVRNSGNQRISGKTPAHSSELRYTLCLCRSSEFRHWKVGIPMCWLKNLGIRSSRPRIECKGRGRGAIQELVQIVTNDFPLVAQS